MLRTSIGLILAILLLMSCRPLKTMPKKYAKYQDKERSHMIAVFMDGTRDRPHKYIWRNSHVLRTYNLSVDNIKSFYIEGVGAGTRLLDGRNATTTSRRIMKAYRFLAENYRSAEDSICLFGFSRGANQCRILSNLIYTIGIINLQPIKKEGNKKRLLLRLYKADISTIGVLSKRKKMIDVINKWNNKHSQQAIGYDISGKVQIELMCLWDAVEGFSIGDREETTTPQVNYLNQLYNVKKFYHAVSLDDNRSYTYTPILGTHKDVGLSAEQDINLIVEEVWFNGNHKDVGGGIRNKERDRLSGISLKWMLDNLKSYKIVRDTQFAVNSFDSVNNSRRDYFGKKSSKGDTIRGIDKYLASMKVNCIKVHQSVIDRLEKGIIQEFKLKKDDKTDRLDWYDWKEFKDCFEKKGKQRIFLKDKCKCIEVVDDKAATKTS